MKLLFSIDEIMAYRIGELKNILSNVSSNKHLNISYVPSPNKVVFSVSDTKTGNLDFRFFRFKTISRNVNAHFYEIWHQSTEVKNHYYLYRSYIHFYLLMEEYIQERPDSEFILLHSDPNTPHNEPHYKYKIGPHLHFQFAPYDIGHSHIALDILSIDKITTERDVYNKAFSNSLLMIKEQILSKL